MSYIIFNIMTFINQHIYTEYNIKKIKKTCVNRNYLELHLGTGKFISIYI